MPFRPEYRTGPPSNDSASAAAGHGERTTPSQDLAALRTAPDALQSALPTLLTFSSLLDELRLRKVAMAMGGAGSQQIRNQVLQFIAERARSISGASGIAIALAEREKIVCRGTAGDTAPPLGLALNLRSGLTAVCFTTCTVVRCDDSETDSRVDRIACRELGIRSVVAVPLLAPAGIVGLIEAFEKEAYAFTDADVRELSLLAELTVEAIRPEPAHSESKASNGNGLVSGGASGSLPRPPAWHGGGLPGQNTSLGDWTQLAGSATEETALAPSVASGKPLVEATVPPAAQHKSTPDRQVSVHRGWLRWILAACAMVLVGAAGWFWYGRSRSARPALAAITAIAPTPPRSAAQVADVTALPRVTGVRHWSNPDGSTVVIDLQDEVPYEIHKLSSPNRILVDLHDTALAHELDDKNDAVDDALLSRIRIGQSVPGVTRVELETTSSSNFSVSMESNPFRLILEIRSQDAPPKPKLDTQLVLQNTAHPVFAEISKNPTAEDTRLRTQVPHLRIVVDAGHGGWDMGTVGRQGLLEKDLALEIAQRLGVLLEQRLGLEVIYTRTDDTFVPLGRRAAIANQVGADLFVSVHANYSSQSEARGVETYYTSDGPSTQVLAEEEKEVGSAPTLQMPAAELKSKSNASRKLATSVQQSLYGSLAAKSPGVRNRGVKAASFVVLTGTTMPAILAEVSFVSSPADEHNLQDPFYRQNIAEALYRGLARYAATSSKANVATAPKSSPGL